MSGLPEEIIEENILTRLPVKSISRFRCVSKAWHLLFQNPNFIRKHLNHANLMNKFNILVTNDKYRSSIITEPNLYSIDYNVVSSPFSGHALEIDCPYMSSKHMPQILGCCNGLVCIQPFYGIVCIWNPATREYKQVAKKSAGSTAAYGFGFDCKNDDYKLLRIFSFQKDEISKAKVYSLASDSWKDLGSIPYYLSYLQKGFLLNGVVHWIGVPCTGLVSSVIVCYDFSDETFHHVPLPNNNSFEDHFVQTDLGTWEGKLCLLTTNYMEDSGNDHVDVWTMMDNKWSKHLRITAHVADMYYRRPIQCLESGEILLEGGLVEIHMTRPIHSLLLSYDPNLEIVRALEIHGFPHVFEVDTYVETLVALNSGTYVEQ